MREVGSLRVTEVITPPPSWQGQCQESCSGELLVLHLSQNLQPPIFEVGDSPETWGHLLKITQSLAERACLLTPRTRLCSPVVHCLSLTPLCLSLTSDGQGGPVESLLPQSHFLHQLFDHRRGCELRRCSVDDGLYNQHLPCGGGCPAQSPHPRCCNT